MGAAVALVLLAASSAPAAAGFRYVPPAGVEAAAEPAAKSGGEAARGKTARPGAEALHKDIQPPPGADPTVLEPRVSGTSVLDPRVWRVREGEMLRAVLARWGTRAGTDVVFLTDRRYRLDGDAAFEGGFADAVQALFRSLSHLPRAPVAARSEGGTTLVVRHRLPAPPARGETQ